MQMTSPLARVPGASSSPVITNQQYGYETVAGRQTNAVNTSQQPSTSTYRTGRTEETQTSRPELSFHAEEPTEEFKVLPEAQGIWKQARSCFIAAEKARIRSEKLISSAKQRLVPAWAIATGPTPPQFLATNQTFCNRLGENLRIQACDTLFILAEGLKYEAQTKESQGQALYSSLQAIYTNDTKGLQKLTDIITKFVKRDAHFTEVSLNKQEASMRAQPNSALDILKIRNPPAPSPEETNTRTSRRRSRQSTSRSPQRQQKRRRSNSRPRRSQSRRRRGNNRNRNEEDRLTGLFRQFLRLQNK